MNQTEARALMEAPVVLTIYYYTDNIFQCHLEINNKMLTTDFIELSIDDLRLFSVRFRAELIWQDDKGLEELSINVARELYKKAILIRKKDNREALIFSDKRFQSILMEDE